MMILAFLISWIPLIGYHIAKLEIIYMNLVMIWNGNDEIISFYDFNPRMNFPYFYMWFGKFPPYAYFFSDGIYKPSCPVGFIYGKDKKRHFHGDDFIKYCNTT